MYSYYIHVLRRIIYLSTGMWSQILFPDILQDYNNCSMKRTRVRQTDGRTDGQAN